MKIKSKKLLATLLALVLVLCMIPLTVLAESSLDNPTLLEVGTEYNTADYTPDEDGYVWFMAKLDNSKYYTMVVTSGDEDSILYPDRGTQQFEAGYTDGDYIDTVDYKRVFVTKTNFKFKLVEAENNDATEEPDDRDILLNGADNLRIYGDTRIGTSFAVADELKTVYGVEKFDNIIVANGLNFPDALSGSYLACEQNAPILLVTDDTSKENVLDYINKNLTSDGTVTVLGGNESVSTTFVTRLRRTRSNVTVLDGDNRLTTNLKVLKEAGLNGTELLVANATGAEAYADAVSASSTDKPLMLVGQTSLTDAQKSYLVSAKNNGYLETVTVLGGVNAVPDSLYQELVSIFGKANVTRLAGDNRYSTSVKVAEHYFTDPGVVGLAWGGAFADALCAGPLANALNAPVILTTDGFTNAAAYASTLTGYRVVAFGGAGAKANQLTDSAITAVKAGTIETYHVAM